MNLPTPITGSCAPPSPIHPATVPPIVYQPVMQTTPQRTREAKKSFGSGKKERNMGGRPRAEDDSREVSPFGVN